MMPLKKNKINNCSSLWTWAIALLLSTSLISCSDSVYNQTIEIPNSSWATADSLTFDFEITDTTSLYNVFLEVNHKTSFSYQNIYCLVESYGPQGLAQRQIASLELASKKGKWLGECSSDDCDRNIPFIINTKFDVAGKYKIIIKQHSRTDALADVNSFRLQVKKVEQS